MNQLARPWFKGLRVVAVSVTFVLFAALVPFTVATPALAAATFVVNSTGDESRQQIADSEEIAAGDVCKGTGSCTLRAAIEQANDSTGADTINFNIGGGGPVTLAVGSALPAIIDPLTIDGSTQPANPDSLVGGSVTIDGTSTTGATGLSLASGSAGSSILGLIVHGFDGPGIGVFGTSDGNIVTGNIIHGNGNDGIQVQTDLNTIGGPDTEINIIYGNTNSGVQLAGNGNTVANNVIGTSDGVAAAPNNRGIFVTGAGNTIEFNTVSGNATAGVHITNTTATNNLVYDNLIGTSPDGSVALPNVGSGVLLQSGATGNEIGSVLRPNTISGNGDRGVLISSASSNQIIGNLIGTDVTGLLDVGNQTTGIEILGSANTTISQNVVSGNGGAGIDMSGTGSTGNVITGNKVGTNEAGTAFVRNDAQGIGIQAGASNNIIGGLAVGEPNLVSGNTAGFYIHSSSALVVTGNQIVGNLIGTNINGTAPLGNAVGVELVSTTNAVSDNSVIGNTISGNSRGIHIRGASSNIIQGNRIGTASNGSADLGNTAEGIRLEPLSGSSADDNLIGGLIAGEGNIVSGNGTDGILVTTPDATLAVTNIIRGNQIGVAADGVSPLGNGRHGVAALGATVDLEIGGVNTGAANVIAHNGGAGVWVEAGASGITSFTNAIHSNGGLGIDLDDPLVDNSAGGDGVTPNDEGDGDSGGNDLQNFPVLTAVDDGTIQAYLDGPSAAGGSDYDFELFLVASCDSSSFGEGDIFVTGVRVTSDGATGDAVHNFIDLSAGTYTATATAADGSTSEFSACLTIGDGTAAASVGFEAASSVALEGTTQLVDVVLSISNESTLTNPVTVFIADAGTGSATVEVDYNLITTQVVFPPESGDGAVQQVEIAVVGDTTVEPTETLNLQLTGVTGPATINPDQATHTVSIVDTSVGEGIAFTAVDPGGGGGDDVFVDGPPIFPALGFIPFSELDPLAAVRADSTGAEAELASVGSGIAAIGSGIAAIGSGIAAIGSGIAAIGSGIAAIGSGIAAIGSGIAAIDIESIGSGIAAIGSGIAAIDPPLSTIPITASNDSWEERLAGTVFEGSPLQSITLSQVATDAPGALVGLTLGGIDYSGAAFGSLSLASVTVGGLTLGSVFATEDDCDAAFAGTTPPANCLATKVIEADVAGADMRAIGSGIAAINISSIDLDFQPIGTTTIGAIGSGIAAIDLIFDCSLVDCSATSTVTLAQAQNLGAIELTLLGELYLLLLPVSSYDWTQMPIDLLQVDVGPIARYDLTFIREGSGAADSTIKVTLPFGVHYEPGTATLFVRDQFGNFVESFEISEPAITGQQLEWVFTTSPGLRYDLSFRGRINVVPLGVHRASAQVTTGESSLDAPAAAPITVVDNFEDNNSPTTAETINDTGLFVSYLPTTIDEDYFTFAIPEGQFAKVLLHHLDEDFDLLYYEPTSVTDASTRPVSDFGPTTPPLDDEGRHTDDVALDPEAADDLDLEAIGSGIAAIGSGIAAIGSNRGTDGEVVEGQADGTAVGGSGIRVAGYNSGSSDEAYLLQLKFVTPFEVQCGPLVLGAFEAGALPAVPANVDTLILWNAQRTEAVYGAQARTDLAAALAQLAQELTDLGHVPLVIPVDGSPAVRDAYAAWDQNPCSASGANGVVAAINDLVDGLGLAPPELTSITLIGGDVVVPYERRPDLTDIANEREYGAALQNTDINGVQSGEFGALSGGWVLSNDAYAAFTSIYDWIGHRLYLPDVPIGRMVETPVEIIASIGQFVAADGVLNPATAVTNLDALVTGYDFLSDGANVQADALDANFAPAATDRSLITDTWNANELEAALLSADPDNVIGLGAHFDHQRLFPADIGSVGSTSAIVLNYPTSALLANAFSQELAGRVIFSVGCHSGLTVPDGITLPGGGSTTDWAQAFSSVGAAFVGNTGFGYGLDGAVGLSERLMQRFSQRLNGTFFLGDALASAKREHFAHQLVYGPYDEKVLAESTLFGFPFWRLVAGDPAGEPLPGAPPSGTQTMSFDHDFVSAGGNGNYYQTDGQSTELFHRPIQPQASFDYLTTDGTRATGVMIRGLASRDETPFDPAFARPIFDLSSREPELETPGTVFPNVFAATNSRETADGIVSTVALATGQFIGEGGGVQRLFTDMDVQVLFGSAVGTAPEIVLAEAQLHNPSLTFTVVVNGSANEVLVVYKEAGFEVGETTWSTRALSEVSSGVWTATVTGVGDQVEWFAQVRDGSFVGTSLNKGVLFAARLVDAGTAATVVEGDTYTLNGSFLDPTGGSGHTATVDWGDGTPSEPATIDSISGSTARSVTANHVYTDDGSYPVEVCVTPLDGGTECDTLTVTVVNADPAFDSFDLSFSGDTVHVAAGFGDPGTDDTHTAVVDWGDGSTSPALVDPATRTLFADHTYAVGTDPTMVTITVTVTDDDGGSAFLEVVNGNVAPVVGPVTGPTDPVAVDTTVPISAAFADFDATGGYTAAIDWGDGTTPTAGTVGAFDDASRTGTVTGDHVYTAAGVYTVTVTVTDGGGASGSGIFEFVVVYDPEAGFVTGGGWINSPLGAYLADPTLTGKASFGFVSRYKKGATVPTGTTQFRFHAASFEFFSDTYQSLVVSGARAQFQGVGTITGLTGQFKFKLTALDADVNKNDAITSDGFRIKIWFEDSSGEHIVYDSGLGVSDAEFAGTVPVGGGSITISSGR